MGKPTGRKKQRPGGKKRSSDASSRRNRSSDTASKAFDEDLTIFINMSQELREEGNKLFQRRDHEGAMLKFEKALKLLPSNHVDIAYLHTNIATCFMQMGPGEYDKAINECNLALEICPKYSKALLKRARCYLALDKPELAFYDVNMVLNTEPQNIMALDIGEQIKRALEDKGMKLEDVLSSTDNENSSCSSSPANVMKSKAKKKRGSRSAVKMSKSETISGMESPSMAYYNDLYTSLAIQSKESPSMSIQSEESPNMSIRSKESPSMSIQRKESPSMSIQSRESPRLSIQSRERANMVIQEKGSSNVIIQANERTNVTSQKQESSNLREMSKRTVKLVMGDDIRCAQLPSDCSIVELIEIVRNRFPNLKAFLIKYKDMEGDLVTITNTEELRWAKASAEPQGSVRLYVTEVSPHQEPLFEEAKVEMVEKLDIKQSGFSENGGTRKKENYRPVCAEDWILQFAQIFQNHVGVNSDACLDLHELGMKLYAEAMEDTVTSEEAQELFAVAAENFQEMTALSLFYWGNVHMSRARKKVIVTEDATQETVVALVKTAYEWAESEYVKAGEKYKEALKFKPNFYEGHLALGQQQFERAKLSWYYAIGSKVDLETWPSKGVIDLFDSAEDNVTKGSDIWEVVEEQRLNELSNPDKGESILQKMGMDGIFKDVSAEEAAGQVASMSSQINLLWGTVLYERSIVEFKLGIDLWEDTLETAIERFELAGASQIDIAVMRKSHCSDSSSHEGLGYDIDEIVQAWNEMCDAKKWMNGVESFRLEPLLRRRIPKLHRIMEHV